MRAWTRWARVVRIEVTLDRMHARLDRIEATLDRMEVQRDTLVTKRQLRFWWIVLTLEITAWTLMMTCWG